ncbi:MAG: nickel-dependent lactate racemase [Peptostreptococcaceae bacterium]
MGEYSFKYGETKLTTCIEDKDIIHTLKPNHVDKIEDLEKEVNNVLNNPIGTRPLNEIVKPGEKVAIVVSDITRAWMKSDEFVIHIVNYLTDIGVKDEDMFVVIALGGHRKSTEEEMIKIVGKEVYNRVKVYDHECEDKNELVYLGESSRNTPIYLNKKIHEANRVIITGGIVFHIFAGFGGGAKSILPGVVGIETIQANHRLSFNPGKSSGLNLNSGPNIIEGNPLREDMNEVCKIVNPDFLFNVVLDTKGDFIKFVGGHYYDAWYEGAMFIRSLYGVPVDNKADIIIASAGGFPKDINLYQSIKTTDNALHGGKDDSVIILLSQCQEGLGAEEFADWFKHNTLEDMENALKDNFTVPGYAAYKTAYTARYRKVILISDIDDKIVSDFNMIPCHDLDEALKMAYKIAEKENPKITLMPYGGNTLPISI